MLLSFSTMSEQSKPQPESLPATPQTGLVNQLVDQFIRAIDEANKQSALERVVKQKCLQAGAVGPITPGVSLIPGGGTLVTFNFGVTADLDLTLKM
jgi:hypothetical protein